MTGESKVKSTSELHQPFSEKYRPLRINHFIGLERAKQLLTTFAASPYASAWLFLGPSGVGKTTMGLALADEISAQLHHVPAKSCRLETVEEVCASCYYSPRQPENWKPPRFHLCLIDEADGMSNAAQSGFLSKLDTTAAPPNTIFVFTANAIKNLEPRFVSRCRTLEFTSNGMAEELEHLLRHIWDRETVNQICIPDFAKIVRDSGGNVRSAINLLEIELICAKGQGRLGGSPFWTPQLLGPGNGRSATNIDTLTDEIHPLQLVPERSPKQFAALKSDIKRRGVLSPVLRYQGKILDGRGRWRACKELGIECPVLDYDGADPVAEIVSLNAIRRHLNASQRAMLAARIANFEHGGDRKSKNQGANLPVEKISIQQAAELLNVSPRSVEAARKVLSEGNPGLVAAIDAGKMSVSKATKTFSKSEKARPAVTRRPAKESVVPEPGTLKGDAFWLG